MNTNELIEALDQRYGNPHSKEHDLVKEAIKTLRLLQDEVTALREQVK